VTGDRQRYIPVIHDQRLFNISGKNTSAPQRSYILAEVFVQLLQIVLDADGWEVRRHIRDSVLDEMKELGDGAHGVPSVLFGASSS
jgi:hypothetical protein